LIRFTQELIAQTPIEPRDSSRLLIVNRSSGTLDHRYFHDIGDYLRPGDLLIANQSRVIPARLLGQRLETGGAVEILLLAERPDLGRIIGKRWCAQAVACVRERVSVSVMNIARTQCYRQKFFTAPMQGDGLYVSGPVMHLI